VTYPQELPVVCVIIRLQIELPVMPLRDTQRLRKKLTEYCGSTPGTFPILKRSLPVPGGDGIIVLVKIANSRNVQLG